MFRMRRKWPVFCGVAGLGLYGIHALLQYLVGGLPEAVSDLMRIVSVVLMLIGVAYSGVLLGKVLRDKQ